MPLKHSVEEIKLKNGARGLLIYVPGATSVYYDIHFWAGVRFVRDQAKSQAAHIMEHMAFGANERFKSGEDLSREFSKNGANHNAFTSNIDMSYYTSAAIMEWQRILDLHLLAITKPVYTQKSLEAEKGNVREELTGYATRHGRILWQETMRRAGLNRWHDPTEIATIDAVELDDITEHFQRTHTTSNMQFVIVGDLHAERETIVEMLENVPLEQGSRLEIAQETATPSEQVFIARTDLPNLTFSIQFFLNRVFTRQEFVTLSALTHLLTGTFHSRMLGKARTRGICYGMGSDFESLPTGMSSFLIDGQVSFDNAEQLFELIAHELNDIALNGVTDEELRAAKEYGLGSLQMSHETVRSLANWYTAEYYEFGRIEKIEDAPDAIARITKHDMQALVKELIDTGLVTVGGIGNTTDARFAELHTVFTEKLNGTR